MSLKSVTNDLRKSIENTDIIAGKFASLTSDEERICFSYDLLRDKLKNLSFTRVGKCAEKSRKLRETGNDHFRKGDSWKAVNLYTESIANAPNDSQELHFAFGNRASALLRLNLPQEALTDVEKALSMNIAENFKQKMLERKEKCLKNMENKLVIITGCKEVESLKTTSYFESTMDIVGVNSDEFFGRFLYVTDNVKTGEILAVEKPFSSILVPSHYYTHCAWCFKRSFTLLPCPNCITSVYCSKECMEEGSQHHVIDCNILEIMTSLQATTLQLIAVKVLTDASKQGLKLGELAMEISKYDPNAFNKGMTYSSSDHNNIYRLVGNVGKRNISDLFHKSLITCVILIVLEKFSPFFDTCGEDKEYLIRVSGGIILRYLQSMPCNAHEISEFCDDGYEEIGAGVYATLSLINHSCDPNVVRHCHKDSIVLRAIRPIKKGEQLFDNYGYHYALLPLQERQKMLLKQYYFQCQCEACTKNWPLQQNLPHNKAVFKRGIDLEQYKSLTKKFKKNVDDILKGEWENDTLTDLMSYLDFLDEFVERPWKPYNICQEALKHCLGIYGNCFRHSKGVEHKKE